MRCRNESWRGAAFLCAFLPALFLCSCGDKTDGEKAPDSPAAQRPEGTTQPAPLPPTIKTKGGEEMVHVPGGWFEMGTDSGNPDEAPAHKVWVDSFLMDQFEVIQKTYERIAYVNAAHFKGADKPVEMVRWYEAMRFCNDRSRAEGLEECFNDETMECDFEANGYRLPTEAEWEYAARAGSETRYSFGNTPDKLRIHGWYAANGGKRTHPAGSKKPNAWGLFDMHGNVAEWCLDRFAKNAYKTSAERNPRGPNTGDLRVARGGSWKSNAEDCTATKRVGLRSGMADACFADDTVGFRCVRKAPPPVRKTRPHNPNRSEAERQY